MKRNKIIGIAIATAGLLTSFSTAIALYTKEVSHTGFAIGAATYTSSTDNVDYKINGASNPTVNPSYFKLDGTNGGSKFDDTYRAVKYEYTLGASYAQGVTAQQYIMGNLSVSLTGVASALQGKVEVSMYFEGYVEGTLGAHYYSSNLTTGTGNDEVAINNTTISGASLSVNARDICVAVAGVQKLVIYLKLDNSVDVLSMNEANSLWNISVTWGQPSNDFDAAYVVSSKTLWEEDDEYVMAPNINKPNAQGWEWTAVVVGATDLAEAKCRQNNTWSDGNNAALTSGTTYDVYWTGGGDAAASFTARQ